MGFNLSQSSIKDLAKDATCPKRWEGQWVNKEFRNEVTVPMAMGLHFEQLVLGSSATDGDTPPLPTTSTGKDPVDVVRMRDQAKRVRRMLFDDTDESYLGYEVTEDQQVVWLDGDFRGVVDFMATNKDGEPCMFDLKLTKDLSSTFGPYAWGNIQGMDLFQQVTYQLAWEQETGTKLAENNILVVDYSPELRVKLFKLNIKDSTKALTLERLQASRDVIEYYNKNGYSVYPSESECGNCPLDCSSRFVKPDLLIEEIDV